MATSEYCLVVKSQDVTGRFVSRKLMARCLASCRRPFQRMSANSIVPLATTTTENRRQWVISINFLGQGWIKLNICCHIVHHTTIFDILRSIPLELASRLIYLDDGSTGGVICRQLDYQSVPRGSQRAGIKCTPSLEPRQHWIKLNFQVSRCIYSSGQRWGHGDQERSQDGEAQVISDTKRRPRTEFPLGYWHPQLL